MREASEVTVVVAALEEPVIVSVAVKEPEGIVSGIVVESGLVMTEAVVPLVPPVIVSPMVKLPLSATVRVIVPSGYEVTPAATV